VVASSNMASLGGQEEPEPDMEHDPTLASCCRREIKDRRIKQSKLDHIRSGMPAAVRPCTVLLYCPRARPSSRRSLSSVQCMPRLSSFIHLSQLVDKSLITSCCNSHSCICAQGAESRPLTASTSRRTCCEPGLIGDCSITRGGRKYSQLTRLPPPGRRAGCLLSGQKSTADKRAEHGAMTEEEIDAALNDEELDLEFEQLRLTRLQQLRFHTPRS
jgi:hypothetical protein